MSYRLARSLGDALGNDFPWKESSQDTLQLQLDTNETLKTAGYCPIPVTGFLEGSTCGARNFLTLKSKELFGKSMVFVVPDDCIGKEAEWQNPVPGCYKPGSLPFSKKEWILIGGGVSALLAVYLMMKTTAKEP